MCNNTKLLKIPPHLKCVAKLPCEMTLMGQTFAPFHRSRLTPSVNGVTSLSACVVQQQGKHIKRFI